MNPIAVMAACAIFLCAIGHARAADSQFPQRPVRLVVPTPPSGGTDF